MKKLALVFSQHLSHWVSCQSITSNLYRAYLWSFPEADIRTFHYHDSEQKDEVRQMAMAIAEFLPEKIIFIDHKPHPLNLFLMLKEIYRPRPLPPFYFHIFGDFSLYAGLWVQISEVMIGEKIFFLCASEKQTNFVSQFFQGPEQRVAYCPFAGDDQAFFFEESLRREWRDKLRLKNDDVAVVYTGRLSLQKNVSLLIEQTAELPLAKEGKLKLLLVGNFDDLGSPLFGIHFQYGHHFTICADVIKGIAPPFREKIHFLSQVNHQELNGILNASDIFCSLGLHHDEDFGMSPLEALFTGLPTILTDWGGYSSFAGPLVGTSFGQRGVEINFNDFTLHMQEITSELQNLSEQYLGELRLERRRRTVTNFSIPAVAKKLREIHSQSEIPVGYLGHTTQLECLGKSVTIFWQTEKFQDKYVFKSEKDLFYREIYSSYVGLKNKRPV